MTTTLCTPVVAELEVVSTASAQPGAPLRSATRVTVAGSEPVFAGHYPGFPIFPGVCLVECAHRSALATAPDPGQDLRLEALESSRFLGPVFPGDLVTVELSWTPAGPAWKCRADVLTERGTAAKVRLRYRVGEGS